MMKQCKMIVSVCLALVLLVGCGGNAADTSTPPAATTPTTTIPTTPTTPPADAEPVVDTTFTIGWVSDPQWYSFAYPEILTSQNDWILENFEKEDMRYIVHTGDFVDQPHSTKQWDSVTVEYEKWDEAGIPYGVLAGNHDVDGTDHTEFSDYFGEERYAHNAWYGESYDDNRGHYDVMTMGETEFLFVYLGYGDHTQEDYDWMNTVLSEHPHHIAVLSFHEYLSEGGDRTSIGDEIFEKVVLVNPNVRMVLCGHNYNATRHIDDIDDDGDGVSDRRVYQMMANYQNLENGGNGFFRLMYCDTEAGTITSRTYSPYLNTFNAFENSDYVRDEFGFQDEFTIPFDFSAPAARPEGSPDTGVVVLNSAVAFGREDGSSLTFPIVCHNEACDDVSDGTAVYDRMFSLMATDAVETVSDYTFVVVGYQFGEGYHITDVVKGESLTADSSAVPIPQSGFVAVLQNEDAASLTVGQVVTLSQFNSFSRFAVNRSVKLTSPWGTVFNIDGNNRKTGADQWVLIDAKSGDSTADVGEDHKNNVLFAFAPTGIAGEYQIVEAAMDAGVAKDVAIPENGFVLSVNTASGCDALLDSMEQWFSVGTIMILSGYTPTV